MIQKYTYMEIFLQNLSEKFSLNEYAKYYNKPHQTIKRHLKKLVNEKILIEIESDRFRYYRLNIHNPILFEHIAILEKERLINWISKNDLFLELYEKIHMFDTKILIFGSAVDSDKFNDIDILILSKNQNLTKIIQDFEKTFSTNIHILQTSEKKLTKTFKEEIIKKHIYINNHKYFVDLLYGKWKNI